MLGRRQLREKVLQSIYALKNSQNEERVVERNMMKGIDQIYDLYVCLLDLLRFQKEIAENKIQLAKQKNLPTKEDLNPNLKFVKNSIFSVLEENEELNSYLSKNKQLTWDLLDSYPNSIFKNIINSELYEKYMLTNENDFDEDKLFIINIYEEFIAAHSGLHDWFETQNIYWADEIHIANSMVLNTIKIINSKDSSELKLFKVFKDDDDREFAQELFRRTVRYFDETQKIVEEKASNWELDRIATIDLIILQMGLTEFLYFPNIPPKVTINEYIELSKVYSTDKSNIFINGILDRSLKEMKENNKLMKQGRGLL